MSNFATRAKFTNEQYVDVLDFMILNQGVLRSQPTTSLELVKRLRKDVPLHGHSDAAVQLLVGEIHGSLNKFEHWLTSGETRCPDWRSLRAKPETTTADRGRRECSLDAFRVERRGQREGVKSA